MKTFEVNLFKCALYEAAEINRFNISKTIDKLKALACGEHV